MSAKSTSPFSDFPVSTYYWAHPVAISDKKFATFREICRVILETTSEGVGDGLGRIGSEPVLDDSLISFNGLFPECRETFFFPRVSEDLAFLTPDDHGNLYRFCETGGQQYDIVVSACLHAAVFCGIIQSFGREEGELKQNLLWESVKQHLTLGDDDAN